MDDSVYKLMALVAFSFLAALALINVMVVVLKLGVNSRAKKHTTSRVQEDNTVRDFVAGLAYFLNTPGDVGRIGYNPTVPCLGIQFRSDTHPIVVLLLDRTSGLPVGVAAMDSGGLPQREPEVLTKAERRLLAELVTPYLKEVPNPSQRDRILSAIRDDMEAGDIGGGVAIEE